MTSSPSRAAFSVFALIVLASGCTSGTKPSPVTTPKPEVTSQDIERTGAGESIEKVLQTMAPGALVSRTGNGGISIQIRGPSSFYSGGEPLYIIDDSPFPAGPGGALSGLNPHDIESIKVLKDPADTGVYGMRGANGVIVITTKHRHKKSS